MKKSFILGLTVLILSMSLMFVGCSTDSDDDGNNNNNNTGGDSVPSKLIGTWVYTVSGVTRSYKFETGTITFIVSDGTNTVTQKYGTLEITPKTSEFSNKDEYPSGYHIQGRIIEDSSNNYPPGSYVGILDPYLNSDNSKFSDLGSTTYIYIKQP